MTYTLDFSLSLGGSKTGLTMAAMIVDTSGGDVGSEVTSGFTEIGEGYYLWHYASIPDAHRGGAKFYEDGVAGTILAFASINPEEAEYTDASIQTVDTNVDSILVDTGTDGVVLAADAITSAKIADDAIATEHIATGAITADSIATDAIDAAALKADAVTEITTSVLTTAMTEAYASDGSAPTLAQALFAIQQFLQERDVADTTVTVKKLDGTTTALTFTINNAAAPTNITRSG